jgi:hypothetical protein
LRDEDVVRPHGGASGTANCSSRWGNEDRSFKAVVLQHVVHETLLGLRTLHTSVMHVAKNEIQEKDIDSSIWRWNDTG